MNRFDYQSFLLDRPVVSIVDVGKESFNFKKQYNIFDNIDLFWKEVDYSYSFNRKFNYNKIVRHSSLNYRRQVLCNNSRFLIDEYYKSSVPLLKFQISISYCTQDSNDYVFVAFNKLHERIGIDVESSTRSLSKSVYSKFFSNSNNSKFSGIEEALIAESFFKYSGLNPFKKCKTKFKINSDIYSEVAFHRINIDKFILVACLKKQINPLPMI